MIYFFIEHKVHRVPGGLCLLLTCMILALTLAISIYTLQFLRMVAHRDGRRI
jgi:uncharacterized iron-regulated membrane protein